MESTEKLQRWEPTVPIPAAPLFAWPPKPLGVLWFFGWKQFWPGGAMWLAGAWLCWRYATPDLTSMESFEPGWIAVIWLRNAGLITLLAGGLHWWLYRRRGQGTVTKFNERWPGESTRFTFGNQLRDNLFWTFASGVTVSTAFEAVGWWMFANGHSSYRDFDNNSIYLIGLTAFAFLWGNLHFSLTHRLLHVGKLYDWAHAVHHRNSNPGPWSGISMHPLEHLVYMSSPVLLWFIPAHPVLVLTLLFLNLLSPALTHAGFERVWLGDVDAGRGSFLAGDYFHQLHHRYFDCNYGNTLTPIDQLLGTYHDGTPEAHEAMRQRQRSSTRGSAQHPSS